VVVLQQDAAAASCGGGAAAGGEIVRPARQGANTETAIAPPVTTPSAKSWKQREDVFEHGRTPPR
jgi:hypothetical protein